MLLVMVGSFLAYRLASKEEAPSREFTELELAGADDDHTGSCYSLSTVLIANFTFADATRTWTTPRENAWTFTLDSVAQGFGGPVRVFQKYTFERRGKQVHLVSIEAAEGMNNDLKKNIDDLLDTSNQRHSTPVERCLAPGATGYLFVPKR